MSTSIGFGRLRLLANRAIESITPTIQPLLDGIRAITGLYIGFFAVGMPKDKEVSPEKLRAV